MKPPYCKFVVSKRLLEKVVKPPYFTVNLVVTKRLTGEGCKPPYCTPGCL
jgi:hypothetical protein